jgi:hypothetical protein
MFDVLDTSDTDIAVLFLKIALRHPDCTNIVNPDIVASGNIIRVSRLDKVVIEALFFLFSLLSNHLDWLISGLLLLSLLSLDFLFDDVLFLLLVVGTFLGVFVVARIRLFEYVAIDVNRGSFHGSSFDIAKRAR